MVALVFGYYVSQITGLKATRLSLRFVVELSAPEGGTFEMFFADSTGFSGDRAQRLEGSVTNGTQRLIFEPTLKGQELRSFRFDPGEHAGSVLIHRILIEGPGGTITWQGPALIDKFPVLHNVELTSPNRSVVLVHSTGTDPQLTTRPDIRAELLPLLKVPSRALRIVLILLAALGGYMVASFIISRSSRMYRVAARAMEKGTVLLILLDILVGTAVFGIAQRLHAGDVGVAIEIKVTVPITDRFQLFYANVPGGYSVDRSLLFDVNGSADPQWIHFTLPLDTLPRYLRFDPGSLNDQVVINDLQLAFNDANDQIGLMELHHAIDLKHDIDTVTRSPDGLVIRSSGPDPYVIIDLDLRRRMERVISQGTRTWLSLLTVLIVVGLMHGGLNGSRLFNAVREAKNKDLFIASGSMVLLLFPALILCSPFLDPRPFSDEKRHLAALPVIEYRSMETYPERFDTWYRDHFGMRNELFRWNSWWHIRLLHTSPLPDRVMMGKDGWLYQSNADTDNNYRGRILFSFEELERLREQYESRQKWLAGYGIRYYLLVPPLSGNINPEHLPDRLHRTGQTTWLDQVKEHFDRYSTVPLIDPAPELLEAKKNNEVYFNTDIHWNPYGAYFGYKKLIDRIRIDRPDIAAPWPLSDLAFVNEINDAADLAGMLGLSDILTRTEPVCIPMKERSAEYSHSPDLPGRFYFLDKPGTFVLPDSTKPKLLMFHDSFGLYMKPLLNEHFSRSTYVWSGLFIPDVVLAEQPDVVVQEFMEMFLVNMPKDKVPLSQ